MVLYDFHLRGISESLPKPGFRVILRPRRAPRNYREFGVSGSTKITVSLNTGYDAVQLIQIVVVDDQASLAGCIMLQTHPGAEPFRQIVLQQADIGVERLRRGRRDGILLEAARQLLNLAGR